MRVVPDAVEHARPERPVQHPSADVDGDERLRSGIGAGHLRGEPVREQLLPPRHGRRRQLEPRHVPPEQQVRVDAGWCRRGRARPSDAPTTPASDGPRRQTIHARA